jgi:CubicO group peptidase (beta-lactamase class C family)
MKQRAIVCVLAAVVVALLRVQAAPAVAPVLSARAAADITGFLGGAVSRGDIPGAVALVVNRDGIVYQEAFGRLDDRAGIAMTKDAIFNIASMTKPVTSVAIMQLVEQGKLRLDDRADKYLPALANPQVVTAIDSAAGTYRTRPARGAITIEQLLTHTSGLGYTFSDQRLAMVQRKTGADDTALPLVADPGVRWTYGASTRALGDVLVKVTGQPLDRYLDARVLSPLGMHDTAYAVPPEKVSRVVTVHTRINGRWAETPRTGPPPVTVRGDGGLYATAADYAQFIRMWLNHGTLNGARIISERTARDMTRNHIGSLVVPLQPTANPALSKPFPLGAGIDKWGLGFQLKATPEPYARSVGSFSWAGIYNTEFWVDPEKQIGGVLLLQVLPFYDEQAIAALRGFEQRVYRALDARSSS